MHLISRVLAIQPKRTTTTVVSYLTSAELDAMLATPNPSTWHGRRDRALLVLAAQTGLRVSELTQFTIDDAHVDTGAHISCHGKGRKDRCTPLTSHTVGVLTEWLAQRHARGTAPLLCTRSGTPMSRDTVSHLTRKYASTAAATCPSLATKKPTPHTLRHTAAMTLLRAGIDITVIVVWLDHESPTSTRIYLHADMALKEQAVARTSPPELGSVRYKAPDSFLAFLDQL
ncbi:hypothetical protein EF847_10250 [Actinobacteria bacterium YIM 96077]|uniref:Tyr recombinase domain-containing protein n=1 Tax=Phytoactinopolyspora halophila TaxID=1981511 RepID=A0A329QBD6_9ACTN|nr:tyrosine-type recombinase/integrase [Phytoactinopolyspora halophila]AYY13024.1 hypothetical protein EF847_10250 [Actinobacteria bacterium YIM 96077]RAW09715.1 hypothetical protein DPM12_20375 [Phytoactinopolyspora halophila]